MPLMTTKKRGISTDIPVARGSGTNNDSDGGHSGEIKTQRQSLPDLAWLQTYKGLMKQQRVRA